MKSILMELYNGRVFPAEQVFPRNKEYKKLLNKSCRHSEDFMERLSRLNPPLDEEFVKVMDEHMDVISADLAEMFVAGFRLGAKIIIDVFQSELIVREN